MEVEFWFREAPLIPSQCFFFFFSSQYFNTSAYLYPRVPQQVHTSLNESRIPTIVSTSLILLPWTPGAGFPNNLTLVPRSPLFEARTAARYHSSD